MLRLQQKTWEMPYANWWNNLSCIPQDQNVFDSKKKVKLTNAEGVEHKLSKKQLQAIEFNKALLAMYTNQVVLILI